MDCFRCKTHISGSLNECPNCGQDLSAYKKAVWASNVYYNTGLERAKANDLSGAIMVLKQSLSLNKMNIDARNLLGLVYFQMGEVAEAAAQWAASRSLRLKDNRASDYMTKIRIHRGKFDYYGRAISKLNQAVGFAKAGNKDVALLQAKKVINMNPNYVKAYLLLGLLYMDKGEYTKAEKTLKRALKIDCLNPTALRYLREMKDITRKRNLLEAVRFKKKDRPQDDPFDDSHVSDEPIVPTYTEISDNWHAVALLLFGLIAGALFFTYLILPSVKARMNDDFNDTVVAYNESLAAKDGEITGLDNKIKNLESDINSLKEELDSYSEDSGILASYNRLLDVLMAFSRGDYLGAMNSIDSVDASIVTNEKFTQVYNSLKNEFTVNGVTATFTRGVSYYDAHDFENARRYFEKCVSLQPDYPEALLRLGYTYTNLGNAEKANAYYTQVIEKYPGTEFASMAMVARGF